jgi:hypothetical protein
MPLELATEMSCCGARCLNGSDNCTCIDQAQHSLRLSLDFIWAKQLF